MTVYEIAHELINYTGCSVFVTGKAGTGKTTLLRSIGASTHKNTAIVAPTGVAAINAGGMTIHSFFRLPLDPYVPTPRGTQQLLSEIGLFDSVRTKIYQSLDLLIIDEISMVRADLLDSVDVVLRYARNRRSEPFGGVQVIFFGDLYQLPPVEKDFMRQYYDSPFFFSAKVIKEQQPVIVELDKIYRTTNLQFIELLNRIRENRMDENWYRLLEQRYLSDFKPDRSKYTTLTTHNNKAERINQEEMDKIRSRTYTFTALVADDFKENAYPLEKNLILKKGARVIFVANGPDYYNGRMGKITYLSKSSIEVLCDGDKKPIEVEQKTWENVRYNVNKDGELKKEVVGTFTQFPLRLAWAITVHKSQGLTFDNLIIDLEHAFARGQIYVALSRCRTLDGIVLSTKINRAALDNDPRITAYCNTRLPLARLEEFLASAKKVYLSSLLMRIFSFNDYAEQVTAFADYTNLFASDFTPNIEPFIEDLREKVSEIVQTGKKFAAQIQLIAERTALLELRLHSATEYFSPRLESVINLIAACTAQTESDTENADFYSRLEDIYNQTLFFKHIIEGLNEELTTEQYILLEHSFKKQKLHLEN